ncbi:MAG: hypothetical protein LUD71_06785, partial [Clostridiales bacterium]|nr:hypothetical protein [Clostridiales bacterium]
FKAWSDSLTVLTVKDGILPHHSGVSRFTEDFLNLFLTKDKKAATSTDIDAPKTLANIQTDLSILCDRSVLFPAGEEGFEPP